MHFKRLEAHRKLCGLIWTNQNLTAYKLQIKNCYDWMEILFHFLLQNYEFNLLPYSRYCRTLTNYWLESFHFIISFNWNGKSEIKIIQWWVNELPSIITDHGLYPFSSLALAPSHNYHHFASCTPFTQFVSFWTRD